MLGIKKAGQPVEKEGADETLGAVEQFSKSTIDAQSAHLCVLDATGVVLATNKVWSDFASAHPSAAERAKVGDNYVKICEAATGPEAGESARFAAGIRAVISGERHFFAMEYACHSQTEQRWFIGRVTRFPVGATPHVVVVHENITERKRAAEALRESEQKFSKLFQSSPIALSLSSVNEGRYLDVNDEFLSMLQRSRDEVVGHTALELGVWTGPEQRAALMAEINRLGVVRNVELEIRGRSGRLTRILWSAELVVIGAERCLLGSSLDITERELAKGELLWKTAFLEAQVDSALDGILVVDSQGKQILRNQRLDDLWKLPRHIMEENDKAAQVQLVAKRVKTPREFAEKVAYLYAHPDEISRDEIELVDGTVLDRYSSPVRDKAGKHYGRIWTFRDVTESRKLAAELRQAQKMDAIGQLASGVAHDFNNILAVIQLQAGLIKAEQNLSPRQLDYAAEIEKATQHAADLTRQLLLFSRKQPLQLRDLELNGIVTNLAKMLQRIVREDIELKFEFSPRPVWIHADVGTIDQILLNLTVNARDAMPNGGRLIIETSVMEFDEVSAAQSPQAKAGSFACIGVTDTGSGISAEALPHIFEPFFTTKGADPGAGLGLATVWGIVEQQKGWINVYSESGIGTIFRVYLPRLLKTPEQKDAWASLATIVGGTETILVVEDDAAVLQVLRLSLTRGGYRVLEAPSGTGALEVWRQHRRDIQLLLTDIVMPEGMNGKELAQRLLLEKPGLKIIYTSGYSAEIADKNLNLQEGVNFLAKPFETYKLMHIVRTCLDKA